MHAIFDKHNTSTMCNLCEEQMIHLILCKGKGFVYLLELSRILWYASFINISLDKSLKCSMLTNIEA